MWAGMLSLTTSSDLEAKSRIDLAKHNLKGQSFLYYFSTTFTTELTLAPTLVIPLD
jgi:hypothetical protein